MSSNRTVQTRLGVDYFPEHWPQERWARDAALMKECGLKVVRIAEFTWSKIQPRRNLWEWEWLDRAIEVIAGEGLSLILCTPSACPPPWMVKEDPTILPYIETPGGPVQMTIGHRRHYSPWHRGYLAASREIAERIARRYGQHPAVIGFQIDNELCGTLQDVGPLAQQGFRVWLKERHGTLEALDRNLGLVFWSQQYSDWDEIPTPAFGHQHPGLCTEWRRCVSDVWVQFCRNQADAMRPHIGSRLLTTNCYLHRWGMEIDWYALTTQGGLDRFAFDNYSDSLHEGAYYNDLARSIGGPYWILEQKCGSTTAQHYWPDTPGRIRTFTEQAALKGAEVITYFRWRMGLFGQEQEHGAIIDHHGEPGVIFEEVQRTCAAVAALQPIEPPVPGLGVTYRWADAWLCAQTPVKVPYRDIMIEDVSRACHDAGQSIRFILEPKHLDDVSAVLTPALIAHDPDWEAALIEFVRRGGHWVVFPMLFSKDEFNKFRPEYLSPALVELFGLKIDRRIPLQPRLAIGATFGDAPLSFQSRIDAILPRTAAVLARFTDEPLKDWPALTEHQAAGVKGKVHYCAGYPDHTSLRFLLERIGVF